MRASFFFAHEPIDHDGQHFWCTTLEGPIGTETINNPPIVPAGFVRRDRPARGMSQVTFYGKEATSLGLVGGRFGCVIMI